MDWNGFFQSAFARPGEYWTPNRWEKDYGGSTRETVRKSLANIKEFWDGEGLWPDTEPREVYGEAVKEPDELIWMDDGGSPIRSQEGLEHAYIEESEDYGAVAFTSEAGKNWLEYRSDMLTQ